jgi:hypothetical protein
MRDVRVVLPREVSHAELREVIVELGGYWLTIPRPPGYGVVARGDAVVYAHLTPSIDSSDDRYSEDEKAELKAILGVAPRAFVRLQIGDEHGSEDIAREVAAILATLWLGVQDWRDAL